MTIVTNPRRDAYATFVGFVYQVNVSILRWLSLLSDQHLELEAGDDVDLIQKGAEANGAERHRLMEQLKNKKRAMTLRTDDALEAIANFCQHRKINPGTTGLWMIRHCDRSRVLFLVVNVCARGRYGV